MRNKIFSLFHSAKSSDMISKGVSAFVFKVGGMITLYLFHFVLAKEGPEANGIFSTYFTILSIFSVIAIMGMDTFLLKMIAKYYAKQQWADIKQVYTKAMLIVVFLSIVCLLTLFLLSKLEFFLAILPSDKWIFYIYISLLPYAVLHIQAESFRAIGDVRLFSFFKNFSIFGLATIFVLLLHKNAANLGIEAFMFSVVVLAVWSVALWMKKNNHKPNNLQEKHEVKKMISSSFPMFSSGALFLLLSWVDILLLGHFESQTMVGIYTIAQKIAALCSLFLFAAITVLGPKISALYHENNFEHLAKTIQKTAKFTFFFSLPLFLVVLCFPQYLLEFFGKDFIKDNATTTLIILAIGQMINVIFGTVIYILDMTGKQHVSRNILFWTAILNIILNSLLIPPFGIMGAALATTISTFCWSFLGVIAVKRFFNFYAFPTFKVWKNE